MTNVVIKIGGNVLTSAEALIGLAADIQSLTETGVTPFVVHGGGCSIDAALLHAGIAPQKINGLRVTNAATLKVVIDLLDQSNALVCANVCGAEAFNSRKSVFCASKAGPVNGFDLGFVGRIDSVDSSSLMNSTGAGKVPVVAPIAADASGGYLNINADHAAVALAQALHASQLHFLSDVPGIMTQPGNYDSLLPQVTASDCKDLLNHGIVYGGMRPKVETALAAVDAGIATVSIIDGLAPQALLKACLFEGTIGTLVRRR